MRLTVNCTILLVALAAPAHPQRPLKVYISVDMEGIAGVVTSEQLGPAGFEYARARQFMTDEALAAIQGARDAGATEILVSDSHGTVQHLPIDQFPTDVLVIRSWPRPLMMIEGIDSTFTVAIFVGYHASTANMRGVRAHTMSSATLTGVRLNGIEVPEGGLNAAIAGHFGVPVVAVTGDDAAVTEVQRFTGPIEGAVVKRAISFHSAATLTPKAAQDLIRARVKAAWRSGQCAPTSCAFGHARDVVQELRAAELLAYLPIVIGSTSHHSVRRQGHRRSVGSSSL